MEEIEKTESAVPTETVSTAENTAVAEAAPAPAAPPIKEHENVIAGIIGSFIFGLGGVVAYVLIYRLGFIAGIIGLITMVLCCKGYEVFSKSKTSIKGVVISIIMTLALTFLAECISLGWQIYDTFGEAYHISFFDAFGFIPEFLAEKEIYIPFIKDMALALLFSFIASTGYIKNAIALRKERKASEKIAKENA